MNWFRSFAFLILMATLSSSCGGHGANVIADGGPPDASLQDGSPQGRLDAEVADAGPDAGLPESCAPVSQAFETLVSDIQSDMASQNVPGAALAVVCGGRILARGLGVTRRDNGAPIRETTRFQTGSLTKMFTAATALSLSEDGLVDLAAPVAQWVPYTNTKEPFGIEITLHHLLSHTAGYPTYWPDGNYVPYEIPDLFQNNPDEPLWAPPGTLWLYSNIGYSLAGLVLQEASGEDFRSLVTERILEPARMEWARMDPSDVQQEGDFAYGHSSDPSFPEPVPPTGAYFSATAYGPMGGLWASVRDLASWGLASIEKDPSVLSPASWDLLRTPVSPTKTAPAESYGYGLFIDEFHSPSVLYHTGSTVGFLGWWYVVPARGIGLFFLTNCDWFSPFDRLEEALSDMADLERGNPADYAPDPQRERNLAGTYDSDILGRVQVETRDTGLYVVFTDRGSESALTPVVQDGYSYWSEDWQTWLPATFWRDDQDRGKYFVSLEGVAIRAE